MVILNWCVFPIIRAHGVIGAWNFMLMLQLTLIPRILGMLYETNILGSVYIFIYTEYLNLLYVGYISLPFDTPIAVCCQ